MALLLKPWLRRMPQPVAVLCDDKRVPVPKGQKAWSELARSIEALQPSQIQCLDKDGQVIRAMTLETADDTTDDTADTSALKVFAKLVADAYDKGHKVGQPVLDSAMAFIERQSQRLMKAEAEVEQLRQHCHLLQAQLIEATASGDDGDDDFFGALLSGALQGDAARRKELELEVLKRKAAKLGKKEETKQ